ncbi:MAG TPA: YidB family protein [Thermoanaerobaculia bacterium]|nr:YidB family protein [Thermoanaerobaculia bacterium]
MGFWDEVVKVGQAAVSSGQAAASGGQAAPVAPAMSGSVVQEAVGLLTGSGSGGLAELAQGFERQGLGHLLGSWLGPGENLPISGQQLQSVLGEQQLGQVAQRLGLPPAAAASTLAAVLPSLVDRLSPSGALEQNLMRQGLEWIEGRAVPNPSA